MKRLHPIARDRARRWTGTSATDMPIVTATKRQVDRPRAHSYVTPDRMALRVAAPSCPTSNQLRASRACVRRRSSIAHKVAQNIGWPTYAAHGRDARPGHCTACAAMHPSTRRARRQPRDGGCKGGLSVQVWINGVGERRDHVAALGPALGASLETPGHGLTYLGSTRWPSARASSSRRARLAHRAP